MRISHIIPLLIIIFIAVIGYTIQPQNIQHCEEQIICEDIIDYRTEIAPFLDTFELFLHKNIEQAHLVGAAVAVVYKGQVVLLKPYGVKKIRTTDSVDVHTAFRLASVSKGFTGILAAKLHAQNLINIDTTVISYLPHFSLKRTKNQQEITLRHILSHTTGVVAHSFDPSIEAGASFHSIFHSLRNANITAMPGKVYTYQNALYSIFDTIVHAQLGTTTKQFLHDSIFAPLGMNNASSSFEEFTDSRNFAYPHSLHRTKGYTSIRLNNRYYSVTAAAGVNASIADMSIWLQALLGKHQTIIPQDVITETSVSHVHTKIPYITQKNWGNIASRGYGLGWRILNTNNNIVVQHGGYVDGYRAEIAYCADKEIGIVFLSNSPHVFISQIVPHFMVGFFNYQNQSLETIAHN